MEDERTSLTKPVVSKKKRGETETFSKSLKLGKKDKRKLIRMCLFVLVTFISCSLVFLYFRHSNDNAEESLILEGDEIMLLRNIIEKYKKENKEEEEKEPSITILTYDENKKTQIEKKETENPKDQHSESLLHVEFDKENLIKEILKFLNDDVKIGEKELQRIIDSLSENKELKEKEMIEEKSIPEDKEKSNKDIEETIQHIKEKMDMKNILNNVKYLSSFHQFTERYNKKYKNIKEKIEKYENFKKNYMDIEKHNKENAMYKKGINQFSDLSEEELKNYFKKLKPVDPQLIQKHTLSLDEYKRNIKGDKDKSVDKNKVKNKKESRQLSELFYELQLKRPMHNLLDKYIKKEISEHTNLFDSYPTNLDYREEGIIGDIRDQGVCGSCYAFASLSNIESLYAKENKNIITLSEQEIIDCSKWSYGCDGGHPFLTFLYALENHVCLDKDYQYISRENLFCLTFKCSQKIGIQSIGAVKENELIKTLNEVGPVTVNVASSHDFIFYKSGIFHGNCANELNHSILLIGYGQTIKSEIEREVEHADNGRKKQNLYYNIKEEPDDVVYYWILKNSWGTQWGENGFMRIIRNQNGDNLFCGIGLEVYYPILSKNI